MGICISTRCDIEPLYTEYACPICYGQIDLNRNKRDPLRNLATPCCHQSMHQTCWEKSINRFGNCPLCRENIVPDEFMKSIHFSVQYDVNNGANLNDALSHTCCFGKCPKRDSQIRNPCFLGETVCFTDDMYWSSSN